MPEASRYGLAWSVVLALLEMQNDLRSGAGMSKQSDESTPMKMTENRTASQKLRGNAAYLRANYAELDAVDSEAIAKNLEECAVYIETVYEPSTELDGVRRCINCGMTAGVGDVLRHRAGCKSQEVARPSFYEELRATINKHSEENESDTPDYILARYLLGCLAEFNAAVQLRDKFKSPSPTLPK